jgi:hypothetical protein
MMKTHPCDIAILTADQAWENYCTALHLYRISGRVWFDFIARQSLDRHFMAVERRLQHIREQDPA